LADILNTSAVWGGDWFSVHTSIGSLF